VKLRKAESLGVFDGHESGVGHVDADFDDRRRDEHLEPAAAKVGHHGVLLFVGHPPVNEADAKRL